MLNTAKTRKMLFYKNVLWKLFLQVVCWHLTEFYHSYFFVWLGKVNNFKFNFLQVAVSAYQVIFTGSNVLFWIRSSTKTSKIPQFSVCIEKDWFKLQQDSLLTLSRDSLMSIASVQLFFILALGWIVYILWDKKVESTR